jgi:hypothetical protein
MKIALLVALTQSLPVAFAQSGSATKAQNYAAGQASTGQAASSGENCGTPDNFKPCPPLPRHPLQTYPGPRKS